MRKGVQKGVNVQVKQKTEDVRAAAAMLYKQRCSAIYFLPPVYAAHSVWTRPETQRAGRSGSPRATAVLPAASKARPPASPQHGCGRTAGQPREEARPRQARTQARRAS